MEATETEEGRCLSDDELMSYVCGSSSELMQGVVEMHIEHCEKCFERLGLAKRLSDLLDEL